MKASLRIHGVTKGRKHIENKKKNLKDPTTAENPKHPNKTPKTSITLHHNNPLAFAPRRTKTPSIIIDILLKVMKFLSIPFNLRSGDQDLKILPLNHLSHDIQKTFYIPLKGNPHSFEGTAQRRTLPRENIQPLWKQLPSKIHPPTLATSLLICCTCQMLIMLLPYLGMILYYHRFSR
jgi:hypothetical protein